MSNDHEEPTIRVAPTRRQERQQWIQPQTQATEALPLLLVPTTLQPPDAPVVGTPAQA